MESEQIRFLQPHQAQAPRRKRWTGCWGGLSCFGQQKGGGKRIVPASRISESNGLANQANRPQAGGLHNQGTGIAIFAPPSSPASFSNSALQSTAQSPSCFLSANSPGGPSSTMYATGPYAHETQLVSPPVFSTFTTEPSTAPFTPPPELAHLTTPSSPDVPYAHFLSSSSKVKTTDRSGYLAGGDLQSTYSLYPGSPASALRSPQWDSSTPPQEPSYTNTGSGGFTGLQTAGASNARQESNFFCPETFAQFYLDQSSFSQNGGRLSISRESDAYSNGANGHHNRQSKTCKPDPEELEAYRASFGFSSDDIISTTHYVEILDESFSITPFSSTKPVGEEQIPCVATKGVGTEKQREDFPTPEVRKAGPSHIEVVASGSPGLFSGLEVKIPKKRCGDVSGHGLPIDHVLSDDDNLFSKMGSSKIGRKYPFGSSNSDAEVEYRRGRSLREGRMRRES